MRTVFNIAIILLLSSTINLCYGQKMKGNVKFYKDTYFSVNIVFGNPRPKDQLHDSLYHDKQVFFDRNGNITEVFEYDSIERVYCKFKANNDYKNNLIETIYARFEPEEILDKKPFIVESVKYFWGEMCQMTYKNDSRGLPEAEIIYDLMGQELSKVAIKRDETGNPLEYKFSDGSMEKFKYDNHGNRVESFYSSAKGLTILTTCLYDVYGNLIEENISDSHKVYYHFHYEHNTFAYKYDKHGNWTEKIDYEHDIPMRIVIRKIEYSK